MRNRSHRLSRGLALTLVIFAALIYCGVALFQKIGTLSGEAQTELVRDAVRRSVITCYAVEGAYPSSLGYLKQHYGLVYDEDNYFVFYDAFASNILPDIQVTERGAGQ